MYLKKPQIVIIIVLIAITIITGLYFLFKPKASNGISGVKASFAKIDSSGNAIFDVTFTSPSNWGKPDGSRGFSYTSILVECNDTCPTAPNTTGKQISAEFMCTTACFDTSQSVSGTVTALTSDLTQGSTYVIFLQGISTNGLSTGWTSSNSVIFPLPPPTAPSAITGLTANFTS